MTRIRPTTRGKIGQMITLYPTDTIYGLGVDATDPEAVLRLREMKGREDGKPISIIVSDVGMMERYAEVTPLARKLAERFLPGKLTLILTAHCATSGGCTLAPGIVGEDGSVGIRIPDYPVPLQLVKELGKPITATSANISGMPTKKTPEKILAQFGKKASMITRIIDAGELPESTPSTVVDARGDSPVVLREGALSKKFIDE